MILQRPKRKKAMQVKKASMNTNQSKCLAPSHALPHGPLRVAPHKPNAHHGSSRHGNLRLPFEPSPPQSLPLASLSSRASPPRAPVIVPYFSPPPPPVPCPVDNHGADMNTHHLDQEPALYNLIYSKFDAVITSIDEENFSGDRRELGR